MKLGNPVLRTVRRQRWWRSRCCHAMKAKVVRLCVCVCVHLHSFLTWSLE